jgi:RND superfamily putative drug exporter
MLSRLAGFCYHHRWRVLLIWIAALVGINVFAGSIGSAYNNSFRGGNTDSAAALSLLQSRFPQQAGDTATIVFKADGGVDSPAIRSRMTQLFDVIRPGKVRHVVSVTSPYEATSQINRTGAVAYATVTFDNVSTKLPTKAAQPLIDAAERTETPGLTIALGGPIVEMAVQQQGGSSELIGIVAAIIILFIAFGSLLAMTLPILSALFGVGIGSAFVVLLSHAMGVPGFAPYLAVMIGLGVGIDYALFIVTRYRSGLNDGLSPEDADVLALATAGRAVLFAGSTVVISLLGMFMIGISLIYGFAIGAVLAVLITMLASITLVPAIIGFAGRKLAAKRPSRSGTVGAPAYRWSRQIQSRPRLWAGLSLALLVTLAVPLFGIRLGTSDQGNDPSTYTTRQAFDLLSTGFGPGFNGPLLLASDLGGATTQSSLGSFVASLRNDADVASVSPVRTSVAGTAAVATVIPKSAPQAQATETLVHRLRSQIAARGLAVHVGGETAVAVDGADQMGQRLPYMVIAVILLSFLLLMTLFRSIVVALKAVLVNLLSIGAAYGVVVAIFQWGWLDNVVGISPGPIEFWVPMLMFTVLFGLSMDYEVFLVSRIRERYLQTGDNAEAVASGLAATARVITAAAAIMVCVFLSFALVNLRVVKLMGVGLAVAIFIDATIVRMILVPSTMEILGELNWWMPNWLGRRLPRLSADTPRHPAPVGIQAMESAVR